MNYSQEEGATGERYALAGASGRALYMYAKPLVTELGDYADVVGVFDVNRIQSQYNKRGVWRYSGL